LGRSNGKRVINGRGPTKMPEGLAIHGEMKKVKGGKGNNCSLETERGSRSHLRPAHKGK